MRRAALRRALLSLPGSRKDNAIVVDSFEDIEVAVAARRCLCCGRYQNKGESSAVHDGKRLRVVRLECTFCEERIRLYFDVTSLFH